MAGSLRSEGLLSAYRAKMVNPVDVMMRFFG